MRRPVTALVLVAAACGQPAAPAKPGAPGANPAAAAPLPPQPLTARDVTTPPPFQVLTKGKGPPLRKGDLVEIHYAGMFEDGKQFDSSRDRDTPFVFELGAGHVILGWDLLLAKLDVGDHVKTTIPADLAYGERGLPGVIPARAALLYDIEVLSVVSRPTWEVLKTGTGKEVRPGATVSISYVGLLPDGTVFVGTKIGGTPYTFKAGVGQEIEGWDYVIVRMREGDQWKIHVPWLFAFGTEGRPPTIPPKTDLTYEIEVLRVE